MSYFFMYLLHHYHYIILPVVKVSIYPEVVLLKLIKILFLINLNLHNVLHTKQFFLIQFLTHRF